MRKYCCLFISIIFIFIPSLYVNGRDNAVPSLSRGLAVFPDALSRLEEEAMEGTAIRNVIFPEGIKNIHRDVFRNTSQLANIFVPSTLKSIDDTAFPQNHGLTILGFAGSVINDWTNSKHLPFVPCAPWFSGFKTNTNKALIVESRLRKTDSKVFLCCNYREFYYFSLALNMDPRCRNELHAIDCRFP